MNPRNGGRNQGARGRGYRHGGAQDERGMCRKGDWVEVSKSFPDGRGHGMGQGHHAGGQGRGGGRGRGWDRADLAPRPAPLTWLTPAQRSQSLNVPQPRGPVDARQITPAPTPDRRNEPMVAVLQEQDCIGCGMCFGACAFGAVTFDRLPAIHPALCSGCGACVDACPTGAIELVPREGSDA